MKKLGIYTLLLSGLIVFSCGGNGKKRNNDSEKADTTITDTTTKAKKLKRGSGDLTDMEALEKKLRNTPHVLPEKLKKAVPDNLMDIRRSDKSITSSVLEGSVLRGNGVYKKDANHILKLYITDGAGKPGSTVVSAGIRNLNAKPHEKTESGFTKTEERNGRLVRMEQTKDGDHVQSKFTFAVQDQFLVVLSGEGFTAKELEKAYDELDFSVLKE